MPPWKLLHDAFPPILNAVRATVDSLKNWELPAVNCGELLPQGWLGAALRELLRPHLGAGVLCRTLTFASLTAAGPFSAPVPDATKILCFQYTGGRATIGMVVTGSEAVLTSQLRVRNSQGWGPKTAKEVVWGIMALLRIFG